MPIGTTKGKSGFYLNTSDFLKDFARITGKVIPDKVKAAEFKVGNMVIHDAIKEEPTVPRKIGDLRGSGETHPNDSLTKFEIDVGFNKEYAAKWHEAVGKDINWTTPGSGPKYLETKLQRYKNKYYAFWAKLIRWA